MMSREAGGEEGEEEFDGIVTIVRAHSYYKKPWTDKYRLGSYLGSGTETL